MHIKLNLVLPEVRGIVQKASELAMSFYQTDLDVVWKVDDSPVTIADQVVEQFLRQELKKSYPQIGVLGEEFCHGDTGHQQTDYLWIIDPIDGTRSFSRGIPIFGIQLALAHQGEIILGIINLPALKEEVYAAKDLGCFFKGKPCSVSQENRIEKSLIYLHETLLAKQKSPLLAEWLDRAQLERNWGDCYSFVLVITGRAEAALDPRMQIWDSAPLPILVQEAGGVFMDWSGQNTIWTGSAVVSNAELAPVIRDLLEADPVL